jgi:hypothetical protein
MSSVVISGDTSGAITVAAPAVAGTNTLTLQAATATNAVNTLVTAQASTSGVSIDFTSIPSWVKRITVMLNGVSTSGTSIPLIQLGDSGGIENTGYSAVAGASTSAGLWGTSTAGFPVGASSISTAANILYGSMTFTTLGSNAWVGQGCFYASSGYSMSASGAKSTSDTLTQIRITTTNGTDTFDAGTINILYEG